MKKSQNIMTILLDLKMNKNLFQKEKFQIGTNLDIKVFQNSSLILGTFNKYLWFQVAL